MPSTQARSTCIETQIPTFFHITPARNHDTRAMDAIPYEENSFYIFDRAYNDFGRLFTIDGVGAYFVVRGKKNNDFKPMRWKRRLPAGVMSDAVGYMDGQLTMSKYPEKIRRILYLDPESGRTFIFFTNALNINPLKVAELYHNRWQIELFFKWLKQHLKVKKFWGQTENAVRIQIYTAVTAYCNRLLHDGDCPEEDGCPTVNLRDAPACKCLTYRHCRTQDPVL